MHRWDAESRGVRRRRRGRRSTRELADDGVDELLGWLRWALGRRAAGRGDGPARAGLDRRPLVDRARSTARSSTVDGGAGEAAALLVGGPAVGPAAAPVGASGRARTSRPAATPRRCALLRERLAMVDVLMAAALGRGARRDARAALLDTSTLVRAVAAGRRRGVPLAVASRRAASRRAQGRRAAAGDDVRRDARRTPPTTMRESARCGGRRAARPGLRQLARRDRRRGDAGAHHQEGRRAGAPRRARCAGRRRARGARPGEAAAASTSSTPTSRAFLTAVGVADHQGRIKPTKQDKYRQVEEFVRLLDTAVEDARTAGALRRADAREPLAPGRSRLRARLPHRRCLRVAREGARAAGARARGRRARVVRASATPRWPSRSGGATSSPSRPRRSPTPPTTRAPTSSWRCTRATPRPTTPSRARCAGRPPVVLAAPCCHHDLQAQVARASVPVAVRRSSPGTGCCASGSSTC